MGDRAFGWAAGVQKGARAAGEDPARAPDLHPVMFRQAPAGEAAGLVRGGTAGGVVVLMEQVPGPIRFVE